jgi:hypothetical protein
MAEAIFMEQHRLFHDNTTPSPYWDGNYSGFTLFHPGAGHQATLVATTGSHTLFPRARCIAHQCCAPVGGDDSRRMESRACMRLLAVQASRV